jgi:hypothetical protein
MQIKKTKFLILELRMQDWDLITKYQLFIDHLYLKMSMNNLLKAKPSLAKQIVTNNKNNKK